METDLHSNLYCFPGSHFHFCRWLLIYRQLGMDFLAWNDLPQMEKDCQLSIILPSRLNFNSQKLFTGENQT